MSGCATDLFDPDPNNVPGINYYIPNFPELNIIIQYSTPEEIEKKCEPHIEKKYINKYGKKTKSLACASVYYNLGTCIIFIQKAPEPWVMQHELAHCAGGAHEKNDKLHQSFINYQKIKNATH